MMPQPDPLEEESSSEDDEEEEDEESEELAEEEDEDEDEAPDDLPCTSSSALRSSPADAEEAQRVVARAPPTRIKRREVGIFEKGNRPARRFHPSVRRTALVAGAVVFERHAWYGGSVLYVVIGLLGLATGVVGILTLSAIARWLVARALGVRGVRFPFGASVSWCWTTASGMPNLLCFVATWAVLYAACGILIAAGSAICGTEVADEASMRVRVSEDGPARRAGLRDGDRIDAVNGVPVTGWPALRSALAGHPSEPVELSITRAGSSSTVRVTPDPKGLIRVQVPTTLERVGLAEALRLGASGPGLVQYGTVVGVVRALEGRERVRVTGPVGVVREVASMPGNGVGRALEFAGLYGAYAMPVFVILGAFLTPRRRPKYALRRRPSQAG